MRMRLTLLIENNLLPTIDVEVMSWNDDEVEVFDDDDEGD